jgi:hypothetical protein
VTKARRESGCLWPRFSPNSRSKLCRKSNVACEFRRHRRFLSPSRLGDRFGQSAHFGRLVGLCGAPLCCQQQHQQFALAESSVAPAGTSLTRAVFFSALMTATAFGRLGFSAHPGISSMGKLLALSLACTLASAALFQPALMGPPRKKGESVQSAPERLTPISLCFTASFGSLAARRSGVRVPPFAAEED